MKQAMAIFATALVLLSGVAQAQEVERFVRYSTGDGEVHWGMVHDDLVYELAGAPYDTMDHTGVNLPLEDVRLEAPVDPKLVFMTAFNFRSHITGEPAEYPGLFIVPPGSIIGPQDQIVRPAESRNLHYEAEMAIIVGKRAENVPVEEPPIISLALPLETMSVSAPGRVVTSNGFGRKAHADLMRSVRNWFAAWITMI